MFLNLRIKFWKKRLAVADRTWTRAVAAWKANKADYSAIAAASRVYAAIRDRIERLERRSRGA